MRRASWAVIAAVAAVLIVGTGCTSDPLADQYREGSNKGYISGDGNVIETPVLERGDPITFAAELSDGTPVRSEDYEGSVLVVNFWFASCAPCREEAPDLEALNVAFADDAAFLGVNPRDSRETAEAFMRRFDLTFPTVTDADDPAMTLAFAGVTAPRATPSTIVLDRQGRVAAQVMGMFDPSMLRTLISDAVAEPSESS